jgi:hypothetical protein
MRKQIAIALFFGSCVSAFSASPIYTFSDPPPRPQAVQQTRPAQTTATADATPQQTCSPTLYAGPQPFGKAYSTVNNGSCRPLPLFSNHSDADTVLSDLATVQGWFSFPT